MFCKFTFHKIVNEYFYEEFPHFKLNLDWKHIRKWAHILLSSFEMVVFQLLGTLPTVSTTHSASVNKSTIRLALVILTHCVCVVHCIQWFSYFVPLISQQFHAWTACVIHSVAEIRLSSICCSNICGYSKRTNIFTRMTNRRLNLAKFQNVWRLPNTFEQVHLSINFNEIQKEPENNMFMS